MSEDILDLVEFKERVQDDTELLLELLDIFVADYETKRATLQESVDSKNYEQLRSVAHSLKGASGNISAKALREIIIKIEEMGKEEDVSDAPTQLAALDETYAALSKRIEEIKNELS